MYFDKEIHIDKIYKRHGDYIAWFKINKVDLYTKILTKV